MLREVTERKERKEGREREAKTRRAHRSHIAVPGMTMAGDAGHTAPFIPTPSRRPIVQLGGRETIGDSAGQGTCPLPQEADVSNRTQSEDNWGAGGFSLREPEAGGLAMPLRAFQRVVPKGWVYCRVRH